MTPDLSVPVAADAYRRAFGWSVIPTHPVTKKPLVKWEDYQREPAGLTTIAAWYQRWPHAGVAIVTGAVSGLWVVDVDSAEGRAALGAIPLPPAPVVVTGKGEHHYYRRPGPLRNTAKRVPGLDTRGDGGYVVAPPSTHPSGKQYTWLVSPWDTPLPLPPAELVTLLNAAPERGDDTFDETDYARMLADGAPDGRRHDDMARLVGHYLAHGLAKREIAVLLRPWVDRCQPPFPYQDLYDTIRDLAAAEARNHAERAGRVYPEPDDAMAPVSDEPDSPPPDLYEPLAPSYAGAWRRQIARGRSTAETGGS